MVRKSVSLNDLSSATSIYTLCVKGDMYYKERGSLKTAPESALETVLESGLKSRLKSGLKILEHIQNNPQFTLVELAKQTGYSRSWVAETMMRLQEQGVIKRIGSDRSGYWKIIDK